MSLLADCIDRIGAFRLIERVGSDPNPRHCIRFPKATHDPATVLRWLDLLSQTYVANGCTVRESEDLCGFVAEKNAQFVASFEIVEVDS